MTLNEVIVLVKKYNEPKTPIPDPEFCEEIVSFQEWLKELPDINEVIEEGEYQGYTIVMMLMRNLFEASYDNELISGSLSELILKIKTGWDQIYPENGRLENCTLLHLVAKMLYRGININIDAIVHLTNLPSKIWNHPVAIREEREITPLILICMAIAKNDHSYFGLLDRLLNKDKLDWHKPILKWNPQAKTYEESYSAFSMLIIALKKQKLFLNQIEKIFSFSGMRLSQPVYTPLGAKTYLSMFFEAACASSIARQYFMKHLTELSDIEPFRCLFELPGFIGEKKWFVKLAYIIYLNRIGVPCEQYMDPLEASAKLAAKDDTFVALEMVKFYRRFLDIEKAHEWYKLIEQNHPDYMEARFQLANAYIESAKPFRSREKTESPGDSVVIKAHNKKQRNHYLTAYLLMIDMDFSRESAKEELSYLRMWAAKHFILGKRVKTENLAPKDEAVIENMQADANTAKALLESKREIRLLTKKLAKLTM